MSQVIAICGTMGAGKSAAIGRLIATCPNYAAIAEDDFNPAFRRSVQDIHDWWERGGRVEEFDLAPLADRVEEAALRSSLVLLETHFGRLHPALRPIIDLQIWIDLPFDIAFARKVSQLAHSFQDIPPDDNPGSPLQWITQFCENYVQVTRPLFERQRTQVGGQSDERVCGNGTSEAVCKRIMKLICVGRQQGDLLPERRER